MNKENKIPKKVQWLFWIILACLSTFFAEVFSGSDMFPFFHSWGIFVVVPLYGLHILVLANLVFRAPEPRFSSLVFAGMIFGLYEAYITKVIWAPPWGNAVIVAEFAPVETTVLVFWWHAWFSFIIPLLVAEKMLTDSTSLGRSLPGKLGTFFNSWGGLASVMAFGGLFQSINSPSIGESLLSGLSTVGVLVLLILLWKKMTKHQTFSMSELLPDQRQFKWLMIPMVFMYLAMGILLRPEWYPGLLGHLIVWVLYGISFYLLSRSQKTPQINSSEVTLDTWEDKRWLLLAGIFPLAAVGGEILFSPFSDIMALIFWFGGIGFGIWMFIKAVKLTFQKVGEVEHA